MKNCRKVEQEQYSIELMHSPLEPDAVEGVVIPELKTAVVSGKILRHIDVRAPGVVEEFLDLNSGLQTEKLAPMKDQILGLHDETANRLKAAYQSFAEALRIHDDWEKIYIDNIDFEKADELAEKLAKKFFENKNANKKAHEKRIFIGAATPEGSVDFVPDITAGLEKRYFIKGRAGSGKSTMLKKIAAEGLKRGFDAEIYQCGFDPESLDMVLFRELGFAIFDSTKPHEYFRPAKAMKLLNFTEQLSTRIPMSAMPEKLRKSPGSTGKKSMKRSHTWPRQKRPTTAWKKFTKRRWILPLLMHFLKKWMPPFGKWPGERGLPPHVPA